MKSLVTGCAGFIGSHLTEKLIEDGEVVGIDCFTDYYPRHIKEGNMLGFKDNQNFYFLEKDILNANLDELMDGIDVVYHLAAQAGVRNSWGKSFSTYSNNNILATQRLLEACKDRDIRFVYSSSSSVYGDSTILPTKETDMPRPISPYGVSKLAGEHLCDLYRKNYGVNTISLRYFTVYGPRQRPDMAFNKFISLIKNNNVIEVFGDGKQTRDFTFVSDIVDGTIKAGRCFVPGIFNLAGGSRVSVIEIISMIQEIMGKQAKINHINDQKGDVRDTYGDISRSRETLGYEPNIDIRKGLELYHAWLKSKE